MKKTIAQNMVLLTVLLTAFLATLHVAAADFESGGVYFNILPTDEDSAQQVEVTFNPERHAAQQGSYRGQIVIPRQVEYQEKTYTVVGIGEEAFKYSQEITGIEWNAAITYIGARAFEGVTNVFLGEITNASDGTVEYTSLPGSVAWVGDRAFAESGLESFYADTRISGGPKYISFGEGAFKDCVKLKKVLFGSGSPSYECFSGCTALESITCSYEEADIGDKAFSGCSALTSEGLWLHEVQDIGERAFENCTSLTWFHTWAGLRTIGAYAFAGCTGLESFSVLGLDLRMDSQDYSSRPLRIEHPGTTFEGCVNLKSATIGQRIVENLTEELCDPFVGLALTSITFTNFGLESAFSGQNYPQLESVSCCTYIPPTVRGFTEEQFNSVRLYTCRDYDSQYAASSLWRRFKKTGSTGEAHAIVVEQGGLYYAIPRGYDPKATVIANPYGQLYKGALKIEDVTFLDKTITTTKINDLAFDDCTELKSVELPSTDRGDRFVIGYAAFAESGIESFTIPKSKYKYGFEIGPYAFDYCKKLAKLTIPDEQEEGSLPLDIGEGAFRECSSLTELNLNKYRYVNIGAEAFSECEALKMVSGEMPSPGEYGYVSSELTIHERAFCNSGVKTLHLPTAPGSMLTVYEGAFYGCQIEKVMLPYFVMSCATDKTATEYAFGGNPLKEMVIQDAEIFWPLISSGDEESSLEVLEVKGEIDDRCLQKNWLTSGRVDCVILNPEMETAQYYWLNENWNVGTIRSCTKTPVPIGTFTRNQYESIDVKVPDGSLELYKQSPYWKDFFHISEFDNSGVDELISDMPTVDIYNIQGICVMCGATQEDLDRLPAGIYIAGGKKFIKK